MRSFYYSLPTIIVAGDTSRSSFVVQLQLLGLKRIWLLTGKSSAKQTGTRELVLELLKELGIDAHIEDSCSPCPDTTYISTMAQKLRNYAPDAILAHGGGAVMDAAKGIVLLAANSNETCIWENKQRKFKDATLPVIGLPTTIGTGSEVNGAFAIYHAKTKEKFVFFNLSVRPKIAWLNPDFVRHLPMSLVREGTFDILSHFLEQYFSDNESLIWSDYATIGLMKDTIRCYRMLDEWGSLTELRENMQLLSLLAMSYLLSQGKHVPWTLHHIVDQSRDSTGIHHASAIKAHLKDWMSVKMNDRAAKASHVLFVKEFLDEVIV